MVCDRNNGKCMFLGGVLNSDIFRTETKDSFEKDLEKYCQSNDPEVYKQCPFYRMQDNFYKLRNED